MSFICRFRVGFVAGLCWLSMAVSNSSQAARGCEAIYPGAVHHHVRASKICIVEWMPGTVEQENDFAAQCRRLTGNLFLDFARDHTTGRVACLFKSTSNQPNTVAELPKLVRSWNDTCMAMERNRDNRTTGCWLRAVEALNPYAEVSEGALAGQVNQLQRAWLHRARGLLRAKSEVVSPTLDSASSQVIHGNPPCGFDPAPDGVHCRAAAAPSVKDIVQPKKEKVASQRVSVGNAPLLSAKPVKAQRKRNFSRAQAVVFRKARAQSVKLAVPRAARAETTKPKAVVKAPRPRNHALLTKTSTTSRCFASLEWC